MPEWNGRQPSILPHQIHTRFCLWYLLKNIYVCRIVTNIMLTKVFNIYYGIYLSINCGTSIVCVAQTSSVARGVRAPTGMQSMQNTTLLALLKPIFVMKTKIATPIGIGNENVSTLTLDLKRNQSRKPGCGSGNFRIASASTLSVSASNT